MSEIIKSNCFTIDGISPARARILSRSIVSYKMLKRVQHDKIVEVDCALRQAQGDKKILN